MTHYSEPEWLVFKHEALAAQERENMENHLLKCESCLNLFLNLTDELELARVDDIIPPDFKRRTMAALTNKQNFHPGAVRSRDRAKRLLSYYTAAAAVTLMLVSGGVFHAAVSPPALAVSHPAQPNSLIFTWPARLLETSSSWTQAIPQERKHFKEVIW